MPRRPVLLALAAAAATGGGLALGLAVTGGGEREKAAYVGSRPPARLTLPEFSLRSLSGDLVRGRDLRGRAVLVTFLDSRCTDACPLIATRVARALRSLPPGDRRRVAALAISTHPADDTPASVRRFLRRHGAERELVYLLGAERELRPAWRAFRILSALDSGSADVHSAPVRLYDRRSVWVSTLHAGADLTVANLRHDLLLALGGGRD
jgi:cytochrome oxidase Cu insertion factor (SCO1/SenC/PrrC family)